MEGAAPAARFADAGVHLQAGVAPHRVASGANIVTLPTNHGRAIEALVLRTAPEIRPTAHSGLEVVVVFRVTAPFARFVLARRLVLRGVRGADWRVAPPAWGHAATAVVVARRTTGDDAATPSRQLFSTLREVGGEWSRSLSSPPPRTSDT